MKLEDQVISLELAKKLKELGVKQESLFVWYVKLVIPVIIYLPTVARNKEDDETASAFTVAELGEMLPLGFQSYKIPSGNWECDSEMPKYSQGRDRLVTRDFTEADARAKMLIHLIEKGFVKPEGRGSEVEMDL